MRLRFPPYTIFLISIVLCVALFTQCSEDAVAPEVPEPLATSVSKVIDQDGGEVRLRGEAWVNIPPGALDATESITVETIDLDK